MDYHKITKTPPHPQGSVGEALSPSKLRKMLNKKKKQTEDQPESSGSQLSEIDDDSAISGDNVENYKDVDVVSVDNRPKDHQFEFQKTSQKKPVVAPFSKAPPSKWDDAQKWIASPTSTRAKHDLKKNRQPKVEVEDRRLVPYEEPDTKQIDSYSKSVVTEDTEVNLSRHDTALSIQNTTFVPPPSTARSVSMRDMGTEMTPIASQEPSRTGTPVGATTPSRSPSSSRPVTPERRNANSSNVGLEGGNRELSEKELQIKTRREIKALGTQLGKMNIAAWASKEEEDKDKDVSSSLKVLGDEKTGKNTMEMRAAAWEDAEKAKYMARFKREEVKIEVWENHQKAKTEAEMRRIEVEVERMRGGAHDRLMNKLAAARHKAEEKRAAAEAKRNREAARAEEQAGYIRQTGRIPSSFSCSRWCC